jgi:acetate kinase
VLGPDDELVASRDLPALAEVGREGLARELAGLGAFAAAGHRVVHGGVRFRDPVLVDDDVVQALRDLTALAPLHQPAAVDALEAARAGAPDVPHVACFDTAFHATIPEAAATYPVPRAWREQHGIRRYGFHGLSHAYAARRAAELLGRPPEELRLVTCHLGAGASLTAVDGGRSVDTTMGFTPLEGLCMATRSGTVDPGIPLWLQQQAGLSAAEVSDGLEHRSGLTGLAGTPDMRQVLAAAADGDDQAGLALDVYVHRLRRELAGMVAALDGLDALVVTGGVGERSAPVRALLAAGLGFLGVALDEGRNEAVDGDCDVASDAARVRMLVVAAREELEIARQVRSLVAG